MEQLEIQEFIDQKKELDNLVKEFLELAKEIGTEPNKTVFTKERNVPTSTFSSYLKKNRERIKREIALEEHNIKDI